MGKGNPKSGSKRRGNLQTVTIPATGKQVSVRAEEERITTREAAEILSVSRPYVVKLIKAGARKSTIVNSIQAGMTLR